MMGRKDFRVAIVGSAGTGKTTLARLLAETMGVALSPEPQRGVIREMGYQSRSQMDRAATLEMCERVLARRTEFETNASTFVADRSCVDTAALWLRWADPGESDDNAEERSRNFLEQCRVHATNRYTHVVVLPWGGVEFVQDGVRSMGRYYHYSIHCMIEGLLLDWSIPFVAIPRSQESPQQRLQRVATLL